ncbi:RNA-binding domain-containing protein [Methyloprofundus sp.]|uniref:RNA-binding domain-containing protein n=1 Tax=Methyloprofundus sp. TaxID=2020875 RepID=UPI003D0DF072
MIETDRIEFKEILTETLEKEVVAFLNYRQGGVIYLGIDKNGKMVGIKDTDATQLKIKDRLKNNIAPSCMGLFDIEVEEKQSKHIIKITLASGSETPYYLKKQGMSSRGCFVRLGSASEPMSTQMIEELFSSRTRNSIGKIRSNRQDLTFEQLKIYYEARGLKLNDQFASNLELLTANNEFNYVAYLMADSNGTSIKVAKYEGITRVNLVENNEYGYCSLMKSTKQVLEKLELENKTATLITSKERINQKLWNPVALREAVINAIVHNDYTRELTPTFEIFDDRLEITSANGLSTGIDNEDFFKGFSIPVNREIMRIYKDLDMVEQLGSGMPRILSYYTKKSFDFSNNFLRITFSINDEPIENSGSMGGSMGGSIGGSINLTPRQQEVLEIIKRDKKISYRAMAEQLDINESAIKKHLNKLKEKNLLKRVGGTRGYWELINND